jgi:hypothetical protein
MGKKMYNKFNNIIESTKLIRENVDVIENMLKRSTESSKETEMVLNKIDMNTEDIRKELGSLGLQIMSSGRKLIELLTSFMTLKI